MGTTLTHHHRLLNKGVLKDSHFQVCGGDFFPARCDEYLLEASANEDVTLSKARLIARMQPSVRIDPDTRVFRPMPVPEHDARTTRK